MSSTKIQLQPIERPPDSPSDSSQAAFGPAYGTDVIAAETPSQAPLHEFSLPPVDGGKDAWLFLAACFMIEGLVWGA